MIYNVRYTMYLIANYKSKICQSAKIQKYWGFFNNIYKE